MRPPRKTSTGGKAKKKLSSASQSDPEKTPTKSKTNSSSGSENSLKPPAGPGTSKKKAGDKTDTKSNKSANPTGKKKGNTKRSKSVNAIFTKNNNIFDKKQPPRKKLPPPPPPFEPLYPMAVFIEELRNEDIEQRLNNFRKISTIALALGPEKTRNELIPFLTDGLCEEDEILMTLAEQLAQFISVIGGPKWVYTLLPPLENLASAEETLVREKAIVSLKIIAVRFTTKLFDDHYYPMIKRMATGEWFTARASSCALLSVGYPRVTPDVKVEIRSLYKQLSQDETQMVRKAAATKLGDFAKVVEPEFLRSEVMPMFKELSSDDIDGVRLACIDACITIATSLKPQEIRDVIQQPIMTLLLDSSWKIRRVVAEKFMELQRSIGHELVTEYLFPAFTRLLRADELEVRQAANRKIIEFCTALPTQGREQLLVTEIVPVLQGLMRNDPDPKAKPIHATALTQLAPLLGKQNTIDVMLPIYLELLKSDSTDVRFNVIAQLDKVNDTIGITQLSETLVPAIIEMTKDPKWRVRKAIIEQIPLLATQLGQTFFEKNLLDLFVTAITDRAFAVRETAIDNLRQLVNKFGKDWTLKVVIPKVIELSKHSTNYIHRITCLFCFNVLSEVCGPEMTLKHMLPTIITLSHDKVPNVRFNVAKTLQRIGPTFDLKTLNTEIKPILTRLVYEDTVFDVRYFADEARQTLRLG